MEELERAVLDWIAAATSDDALRIQLLNPEVVRRDYLRTGYFTYFQVPESAPKVPDGVRAVCPHIRSSELPDGAGTALFFRDGRIHYLEVYARGGFFPEALADFQLGAGR